jgi:hypothetical protein
MVDAVNIIEWRVGEGSDVLMYVFAHGDGAEMGFMQLPRILLGYIDAYVLHTCVSEYQLCICDRHRRQYVYRRAVPALNVWRVGSE